MNLKILSFTLLSASCLFGNAGIASAQAVHDDMRKSLVHLHARGQAVSGPNASNFVDSFATGTLASNDGLILTVYHLISALGDVEPRTVTIEARIAEKTANPRRVAIVDASINTDLMLLKMPPGPEPFPVVPLGRAIEHDDSQPIYTSGFPKSLDYRKHEGKIEGRSGPGGYLWQTSFDFKEGQSGSPVYNADGEVIGVVKGEENGTGFIIPIGFADALLAQIRLREIRAAMRDFDHLRRQFTWNGEVDGSKIKITYEKSVAGEPQVDFVDLKIRAVGMIAGREEKLTPFPKPGVQRTALIGRTGGVFELDGVREQIELFRQSFGFDEINEVEIDIVPTLSDGSELRRKRIVMEYK
jgi:S1-C subfamily serine protease